jgi:hypothetical protein
MSLNCPSCGGAVPNNLRYAKLVVCPTCQTSLFLEDDAVKSAGERSQLAMEPSLFAVGVPFSWRGDTYVPHGRVRFSFGEQDGYWDEWWVASNTGEAWWMSVDEGDIAFEQPLELNGAAPPFERLQRGGTIKVGEDTLTVTEKDTGSCLGVEGSIPEVISFGEKHNYVHLSGPKGVLLTIEYADGEAEVFKGRWIDPFEIETL